MKLDFATIKTGAPDDYPRILAFLEQLKADPRIAEKLLNRDHGNEAKGELSVMPWLTQWKQGVDLWRLRSRDLEAMGLRYRLIYLYLVREARFVIMALVARDGFNYDDPNHPITIRIRASLKRSYGIG